MPAQLNTATTSVIQDFSFGQASSYYYYPAIALDSAENLTTIFSRSSSAESAGLRYASRLAGDPANIGRTKMNIARLVLKHVYKTVIGIHHVPAAGMYYPFRFTG